MTRRDATVKQLQAAATGLSAKTGSKPLDLLFEAIETEKAKPKGNVVNLGALLASQSPGDLRSVAKQIRDMALNGKTSDVKTAGYAAWVTAVGPGDAFLEATKSADRLRDFLSAIESVDEKERGKLFDKIQPLVFELPASIGAETGVLESGRPGLEVSYYAPNSSDATNEAIDKLTPIKTMVVPKFQKTIPKGQPKSRFTNSFKGFVNIPKSGDYVFAVKSDDGSRLYIDGQLVVNNDGKHGMIEKRKRIVLNKGLHPIRVNFYDSGGASGLIVSWRKPGGKREQIPAENLFTSGSESLHDVAIKAMTSIPGNDAAKFNTLAKVIGMGRNLSLIHISEPTRPY